MTYHRPTAIAWAMLVIALPACDSSDTSGPSAESMVADAMAKDQSVVDPTILEISDESSIDIGDVEQAIGIVGTLSGLSASENIVEHIASDARKRVRAVNIEVSPPNPVGLWIAVRVDCTRDFEERVVVLDSEILVDGKLMDSFTIVLGNDASTNSFQKEVEVLFGLDEIPESLLVTMQSEALLLPEGTDLATIDPYSATEGDRTKAIAYTPVRIDFTAPGPKPKSDAVAAETATPSEPSDTDNS